jgi:hypothetical protein
MSYILTMPERTRKIETLFDRAIALVASNPTAFLALAGLVLFAALRVDYGRFYHDLNVSPEAVGLGEAEILARSAAGLVGITLLLGILLLAGLVAYLGVTFFFGFVQALTMITMASIVQRLLRPMLEWLGPLPASSWERSVRRAGVWLEVLGFLALYLLIVGASLWTAVAVLLVVVAISWGLQTYPRTPMKIPRELANLSGIATGRRVHLVANYYGRFAVRRVSRTLRAMIRPRFTVSAVVAAFLFLEVFYLPNIASSRAQQVRQGASIPDVEKVLGIPVLRFEATQARVSWLPDAGRPSDVSEEDTQCLVYLGQAEGTSVFFNTRLDQAIRIPSSDVDVVGPVILPASCRG